VAYHDASGRRITFEVAVIPGVNDGPEDARALAAFAGQVPSNVNLIPYNPVAEFGAPACTEAQANSFRRRLVAAYSGDVVVRRPRGRDIEAACGMLHRARAAADARSSGT
jgi:23S rRNA (adenine2503-C2)-methyltransferase